MSRLNYNKWDNIEISDDSDIETHPNIDKKSMIRWKQRDIHEKREIRKIKLHHLGLERIMNDGLLVRVRSLISNTESEGVPFISRTVAELRVKVPDYEGKKLKDGEQASEDHMILSLLSQVVNQVHGENLAEGERGAAFVQALKEHEKKLNDRQIDVQKEKEEIEAEQKKMITSDDVHDGFDSKTMISKTPSAAPVPKSASNPPKPKKKETQIETINSPNPSSSTSIATAPNSIGGTSNNYYSPASAQPDPDESDADDEVDEEEAELTPSAHKFSEIKPMDFPSAFLAISADPTLLSEQTSDALLVEAFTAAMKTGNLKNNEARARNCVEKSLMISYCLQLGRDGVALYFKRMTSSDKKALKLYLEDVAKTTERIVTRARVVAKERQEEAAKGPREQIQLVASDPQNATITFEIPEGPPPENLEITGEGSEDLDPQLVREFLQKRWDTYISFPEKLRKALMTKSLEKVNKVLGKMEIDEAEEVVQRLGDSGMLNFDQDKMYPKDGESGTSGVDGKEEVPVDDLVIDHGPQSSISHAPQSTAPAPRAEQGTRRLLIPEDDVILD